MIEDFGMRESAGNEAIRLLSDMTNILTPVSEPMGASPETRGIKSAAKLANIASPASQFMPARAAKSGKMACADDAKSAVPSLRQFSGEAKGRARADAASTTPATETNPRKRRKAIAFMPIEASKHLPSETSPQGGGEASECLPVVAITRSPPSTIIADIMALAKRRTVWQNARNRLYLHALALCRSYCDGDKSAAVKAYEAVVKGAHPEPALGVLLAPMLTSIKLFDAEIDALEKPLIKLVEQSPIGPFITATKGLGMKSMATLIGHTGAFSQYRNQDCLRVRLGLGVINGEKQQYIVPGIADYRPRRSAIYVVAAGLLKSSNEIARGVYDAQKAKALGKGWAKAHAHNHAMRCIASVFVRKMYRAWVAAEKVVQQ